MKFSKCVPSPKMKVVEQHYDVLLTILSKFVYHVPVVLFIIMLYKVVLTSETFDQ